MNILAIDPGPEKSAFVVWDGKTIHDKGILDNEDLLEFDVIYDYFLAIEMIASYGMPVGKTVFLTCVWIGRFLEALKRNNDYKLIYRKDVKMFLCQSMRAKDSNIRQALIDMLGAPGTKKAQGVTYGVSKDIWAALGVAVTCYNELTTEL